MPPETHVRLCGKFPVRPQGRRVDDELPRAQGRVLFAYLCLSRTRSVTRAETMDGPWGSLPAPPDVALSALLSKLRRTLGTGRIEGRALSRMSLPEPAQADVELAKAPATTVLGSRECAASPTTSWLRVSNARSGRSSGAAAGN